MLVTIAVIYFSWSVMWIISFFFQESQYFPLSPDINHLIDIGVAIYHMISLVLVIVFYFQSYKFRKHLVLKHYEQKFWLFVGGFAALANILKNIFSESMGLSNSIFFWPATLQNTLVYFASIYCIMILDGWNMEEEPKYIKNSVWILIIAQTIINLTLLVEGFNSYLYPPQKESLLQLLFLTFYRTWLIYFGWKKTAFLHRKTCRWGCEIFIHSISYIKLPATAVPNRSYEPKNLRSVRRRVSNVNGLLSPTEIDFTDPSFSITENLIPSTESFQSVRW